MLCCSGNDRKKKSVYVQHKCNHNCRNSFIVFSIQSRLNPWKLIQNQQLTLYSMIKQALIFSAVYFSVWLYHTLPILLLISICFSFIRVNIKILLGCSDKCTLMYICMHLSRVNSSWYKGCYRLESVFPFTCYCQAVLQSVGASLSPHLLHWLSKCCQFAGYEVIFLFEFAFPYIINTFRGSWLFVLPFPLTYLLNSFVHFSLVGGSSLIRKYRTVYVYCNYLLILFPFPFAFFYA